MDITIAAIALSMGLIIVSTSFGIGKIGSRAVESIARQPEAADKIRLAMLIAAGLIDGIGVIAIMLCFAMTR